MSDYLQQNKLDLSGKQVFITGGASGLGAACVQAFAEAGALVDFCGLPAEAEQGAAIAARVSGARFCVLDVRTADAVTAYLDPLASERGLDIAVNCAGISHPASLMADMPLDYFVDVMNTNLNGVWHAMRGEINAMQRSGGLGGRSIVNVSSILSVQAAGWMAAYGTSKHAVIGLSKSAAADYADQGLRINAVSPGPIDTPMYRRALADIGNDPRKFAGGLPASGPQDPHELAQLIVYLASDAAIDINGANVVIDRDAAQGFCLR